MPTVLLICTGNICRSPMAEVLLRARLVSDEARRHWRVGSAGLSLAVSPRSVAERLIRQASPTRR